MAITRAKSQLVVVGDREWWRAQRGLLAALAIDSTSAQMGAPKERPAADQLHAALIRGGLVVERDVMLAGREYNVVVTGPVGAVTALIVDDPEGDADGQKLRKLLAWMDITSGVAVHRIPVWRCHSEPDVVVAELSRQMLTGLLPDSVTAGVSPLRNSMRTTSFVVD